MDFKEVKTRATYKHTIRKPYESFKHSASPSGSKYQETFIEIAPFTKDDKGKWLNDTNRPILKPNGKIDIDEKIQSFKDETNIYKILERHSLLGDLATLAATASNGGMYGDVSNLPNNYNDLQAHNAKMLDSAEKLDNSLVNALLDEKLSNDEVLAKFQDLLKSRIIQNKVEKKEVNE